MSKTRVIAVVILVVAMFAAAPAPQAEAQTCTPATANDSYWEEGSNQYGVWMKLSRSSMTTPAHCVHRASAETVDGSATVDYYYRSAGTYSQTPWTTTSNWVGAEPPFIA